MCSTGNTDKKAEADAKGKTLLLKIDVIIVS